MSLTSIDLVQAEISDLFDPLVTDGDLLTNLDKPPLAADLEGRSPVLSLHYDGSGFVFQGNGFTTGQHFWVATLFINREGHGNTNTETLLTQLVTKVVQKVRDSVAGSNYDELALAPRRIEPSFATVDGYAYRICEIYLQCLVHDTS